MKHRTAAVLLLTVAFLTTLGWTRESEAQNKIPRVGILGVGPDTQIQEWLVPFRTVLRDQGWIEDQNVAFEVRTTRDTSRFPELVAEVVRLKVDLLFPIGPPAVRATFGATRTIPIVAHDLETDPVAAGYAESYNHPGQNLTGLFLDAPELAGKWFELLKAIVPRLSRVVVLWDPSSPSAHLLGVQGVARSFGVELQVLEVPTPDDIDRVFTSFRGRPQALIVLPSPLMWFLSARTAELAKKHRLAATSMFRPFAESGGALSYGPEMAATAERCAVLVAKVLGGAKPADLPVERPTKFELVVNVKTANALGVKIPDSILFRADEVIR